ncbi:hypothetical protein G5V59_15935 [Nocardioides sp. W3-2-3]|nr:hypothetical protein [Nocardioides convexus]
MPWARNASRSLPADGPHRVERGLRLLEDHRDPPPAHPVEGALVEREEVPAVVPDRAARPRSGRQQAEHGAGGHRLAGAGLAHQGEDLPAFEDDRDVLDRGARVGEGDGEVLDREHRGLGGLGNLGNLRHDGPPRGTGR